MISDALLNTYAIALYRFQDVYSAGTLLSYDHPCIGYLKKGRGTFLYNGTTYYAKAGDLVYIAKGTKYYSVWSGSPEIEFYSVNYSFSTPYAFYQFRFQIVERFPVYYFDQFYQFFGKDNLLALSSLYRVLSDLYASMEEEKVSAGMRAIEPAIRYIENHFADPISIAQLCLLCHCSESWLFKTFRSATGVSPIAYKHNILVQHALDMLIHTDFSVEEISEKLGFSSSNYFRRIFCKMVQRTPREIRRNDLK